MMDILRWKVGATSWDYESEMVYHRWGAIDAHDLNDCIFGQGKDTVSKSFSQEKPEKLFEKYLGASGIGPVQLENPKHFCCEESLITDKALNEKFHSGSVNAETIWKEYLTNYVGTLKSLFDFETVYRKSRRLDRALWAYGHLFNDTESNKKRTK